MTRHLTAAELFAERTLIETFQMTAVFWCVVLIFVIVFVRAFWS